MNAAKNSIGATEAIKIENTMGSGRTIRIRNNICQNVSSWNNRCFRTELSNAQGVIEENNFWDSGGSADTITTTHGGTANYNETDINDGIYTAVEGLGQNSRAGGAEFVDASNNDFRLQSTFVDAIQGGKMGLGISIDINGDNFRSPPNMGAYARDVEARGVSTGGRNNDFQ